jgi:hypothetical protein
MKINKLKTYWEFIKEENTHETPKLGKYVFNSFLKIITALGLKDIKPNWYNTPDDFLLFFEYESDYQNISDKFSRFASLQPFVNEIPQTNTKLYYGIKLDSNFSFGFYDDKIIEIGNFNLNKNNLNYLLLIPSASAAHLKRELAYITNQNLKYISLLTKYIKNFHIGNTDERKFEIKEGILEFKYKGLKDNLSDVKNKFIQHLLKSKVSDKILISVKEIDGWIKLSVKLK